MLSFKKYFFLIALILLIGISSCTYIKNKFESKEEPIARVYDQYLYPKDIKDIVPEGTSLKDSIDLVNAYINNWIRQTVILKKAEDNVNYNRADIEKQLENYKNSLIIYLYEQQLVGQKLDTTIVKKDIEEYYNANKNNFELKKSILKASYAKIPKNTHQLNIARKWFRSDKQKDKRNFDVYCMQFAVSYGLEDTSWSYLDQLETMVPLNRFSESSILRRNNHIEFEDDAFLYLVYVKDFMYKNEISPLSFERDNIKNIIINKRKLKLIEDMENSVYKEALKNSDFEIYHDKK